MLLLQLNMPPNLHCMKNNSWWKLSTTIHEGNLIVSLWEKFQDHWKARNLKQQKLQGHLGEKKTQKTKTSRSCRSKKKSKNTHFNRNTLSKISQAHTFLCKHNFKCTHFHANMFIKKIDYLSWWKKWTSQVCNFF